MHGRTQHPAHRTDRIRTIAIVLLVCAVSLMCSMPCRAQVGNDSIYRVEAHVNAGPMLSLFLRTRPLPPGASAKTLGYSAMVRVMWHPDQLLATGFLAGYQRIVSEDFYIPDSASNGHASGALRVFPLMLDESMQRSGIEFGMAIGAYILQTMLNDRTVAHSSRIELGSMAHASYHWAIAKSLRIGGEIVASYLPYRGILSIVPELDLKYDLLTY